METLGRYRIEGRIAQGGMGAVYLAYDPELKRRVALKRIDFLGARDTNTLIRFQREAEAVARLSHRNLLRIHEFGVEDREPYMVMELGKESLKDRLRRGELPIDEAVSIALQLSEALAYTHRAGVLHRDLKPSNVLFNELGEVLIADFGLAKVIDQNTPLTVSGESVGTPAYMPPEQALGDQDRVGYWSDLYSLGATFYHMLAGQAPFSGRPVVSILKAVLEEVPAPPSKLRAEIEPELDRICLRLLSKRPEDRYPSAEAVARDLRAFADGTTREKRVPLSRRLALAGLAIATSSLAATLIWCGGPASNTSVEQSAERKAAQRPIITTKNALETGERQAAVVSPLDQARALAKLERILTGSQTMPRHKRLAWFCFKHAKAKYSEACSQGEVEAAAEFGELLLRTSKRQKEDAEAISCLQDAVRRRGDRSAMLCLALLHMSGRGSKTGQPDLAEGERLLFRAAEGTEGLGLAKIHLARMNFQRARDQRLEPVQRLMANQAARSWCDEVSAAQSAPDLYRLGAMCSHIRRPRLALDYLFEAAELGSPLAIKALHKAAAEWVGAQDYLDELMRARRHRESPEGEAQPGSPGSPSPRTLPAGNRSN